MYPWRTPGGELKAYLPGWDPTELDYADLTLDFSHASTASQQSLDLAQLLGRPAAARPPDRRQRARSRTSTWCPAAATSRPARCWSTSPSRTSPATSCWRSTRARAQTRAQREEDLAESLAFARLHLAAPCTPSYAVDGGGVASAL